MFAFLCVSLKKHALKLLVPVTSIVLDICILIDASILISRNANGPRGYKTFLMLNSTEHGILNAHKNENINEYGIFRLR